MGGNESNPQGIKQTVEIIPQTMEFDHNSIMDGFFFFLCFAKASFVPNEKNTPG